MPRKKASNKQEKPAKQKRQRRARGEIQDILAEVATLRAAGKTLADALDQVGVHYNTFHKWTQKFATAVAAEAAKRTRGSGKTEEEVRKVLQKIASMRATGMSIAKALQETGVANSTYAFWRRRYGTEVAAVAAKAKRVVRGMMGGAAASARMATGSDLVGLLEEMTKNRRKRLELDAAEQEIRQLDERFVELSKQLAVEQAK